MIASRKRSEYLESAENLHKCFYSIKNFHFPNFPQFQKIDIVSLQLFTFYLHSVQSLSEGDLLIYSMKWDIRNSCRSNEHPFLSFPSPVLQTKQTHISETHLNDMGLLVSLGKVQLCETFVLSIRITSCSLSLAPVR